MERNVMGELDVYRQLGTTPNFSDIARRHGLDRHTVAKYWREGAAVEDRRSERGSGFDQVREVIEAKAALPGATKKGIHEFLLDRYPGLGLPGYNAFTHYMRERGIALGPAEGPEPHPRYETAPGEQMQFDWKEHLRLVDADGVVHEFSVFSSTLGHSRLHRFRYTPTVTTDDLLRCLLSVIRADGGVCRRLLTDNMSALVTVSGGRRRRVERAWRFAREAGFELELSKVRTPETKGKDESANRFLARLLPYEGEFRGVEGLCRVIEHVERRSNAEPNGTTGVPPAVLFVREKEALLPVGNLRALEEMVGDASVQTVPSTMLVRCGGREFSVPRPCIGRRAKVTRMPGGQVTVEVGGELVAVHDMAEPGGRVVYDPAHYAEALACKRRYDGEDIEEAARRNLELLGRVGEGGGL